MINTDVAESNHLKIAKSILIHEVILTKEEYNLNSIKLSNSIVLIG